MLTKFRTLNLSIRFYKEVLKLKMSSHLKDQISRAASSISLNLGEGSGKSTPKDRRKFFTIAYGSLKECQVALMLADINDPALLNMADHLGALLYKLKTPS